MEWRGYSRRGTAWRGKAGPGKERQAWHGAARQGKEHGRSKEIKGENMENMERSYETLTYDYKSYEALTRLIVMQKLRLHHYDLGATPERYSEGHRKECSRKEEG
jgi:hypothetical protein